MKEMLVLAVDTQISHKTVRELSRHYEVVVVAGQSFSDEDWVEDALSMGANVFVSPDIDIPNLLD